VVSLAGSRTALNVSQRTGLTVSIHARVVNANTGLSTVPANTVRRMTSLTMNLDAVGVDATYAIAILRGGTFLPIGAHVATNGISVFSGEMLLQAGDIITNIGDTGSTNGTCDMTTTFQDYAI